VVDAAFWLLVKARLRTHVRGLEHVGNLPGTIIVSTHPSDFDAFLGLGMLLVASRCRGPLSRTWVVANEDVFAPGVFSIVGVERPRWVSRFLYRLDLSRLLLAIRYAPIPFAQLRLLRSHLTDVADLLGDLPLEDVFRESPSRWFPDVEPGARVESVIVWDHRAVLYRREPFSVFRPEVEAALRERHGARIADHLQAFAGLLDDGEAIVMAPQARPWDGFIRNLKSGALQIAQLTQRDPVLLPMNLSYDLMTTGRARAFTAFGPLIHGVRDFERDRYKNAVARALAVLGTVTLSHVAGWVLCGLARNGEGEIAESELKAQVRAEARSLGDKGLTLDPVLGEGPSFERRWNRFMAYCRRERLVVERGGVLQFDPAAVLAPLPADRVQVHPWQFYSNELESFLDTAETS
jgi:hypothetical protein